jgi:DNA modification methylase
MIIQGDCVEVLKGLPDSSVNCCVTSPPYWGLRDYGVGGQLGLEKTPEEYTENMVKVFREVKRVLKDEGTLWLNIGDSYASNGCYINAWYEKDHNKDKQHLHTKNKERYEDRKAYRSDVIKAKDLIGIPWRVAFALQKDGWYLRQDIIWHKPNPMPESVTDRCTKAHEYIFLLAKSQRYYFDREPIREPVKESNKGFISARARTASGALGGENQHNMERRDYSEIKGANKRSVWTVTTKPYKEAHFATFPEDLILPCVLAGCPEGGKILDPFNGAGTTGVVAKKNNRDYIGIELNPEYIKIAEKRIANTQESMF